LVGVAFLVVSKVQAATGDDIQSHLQAAAEEGAGYGAPQDPRLTAALIIRSLLSVVGLVMVALLLFGGFTWMTAGGNEEKVDKSKRLIKNAVIGLAIVLSAYSITHLFTYFALGGKVNILEQQTQTFRPFD